MKRSTLIIRLTVLTLAPITGLAGLLLASGFRDVLFLVLTAMPLAIGVASVLLRRSWSAQ